MGNACCIHANYLQKKVLTADRVSPNTFYIYNWQNGSVYVSTNSGATWTERTALNDFWAWHGRLVAAPNNAGHLWYVHSFEDGLSAIKSLKRSTDGGQTWSSLANTDEVINVALGKPAPSGSYPTLFIQGKVNGTQGYWMSANEGATWTNLGTYPLGVYDVAKVMEADLTVYGRLYVGFGGNGFVYGDMTAALPVDLVSFFGKNTEGGNRLSWQTASEQNTLFFNVERSRDGRLFEKIGEIKTKGTNATYTFTDTKTTSKFDTSTTLGIIYYRLKINDLDGKFTYSKIISLQEKSPTTLKAYPSVSSGFLTIETTLTDDFSIINLLGQPMMTGKTTQQIDVSALPKGAYFLKIGTEQVSFIKQ
jgi:Secretion system C-terminal sorting domain